MATQQLPRKSSSQAPSLTMAVCAFVAVALMVDSRFARSASLSMNPLPAAGTVSVLQRSASGSSLPIELMHDVSLRDAPSLSADPRSKTKTIWMEVTAYCGCKKCCGPRACGLTASGRSTAYNGGLFVAADTALLPFETQIQIPGYAGGLPVEVIDRGRAIKGQRIDVFFSSHEQALSWGRRWLPVTIVE